MGLESTMFIKLNVKHIFKKKDLNREPDSHFTAILILMDLYILISKGVGVVNSETIFNSNILGLHGDFSSKGL